MSVLIQPLLQGRYIIAADLIRHDDGLIYSCAVACSLLTVNACMMMVAMWRWYISVVLCLLLQLFGNICFVCNCVVAGDGEFTVVCMCVCVCVCVCLCVCVCVRVCVCVCQSLSLSFSDKMWCFCLSHWSEWLITISNRSLIIRPQSRGLESLTAGLQSWRLASRLKPWLRTICGLGWLMATSHGLQVQTKN